MRVCVLAWFALWMIVAPGAASDDWPQFRGPGGEGHASAVGLPLTWSESENVVWKAPVAGRGWSSPVVLGDRIFLTTALETAARPEEAEKKLEGSRTSDGLEADSSVSFLAVSIHRATGEILYEKTLFEVENPDPIEKLNSYASPTPVVEPGRFYCEFGTHGTACLDAATGEVLWTRRLTLDHMVGPGSSLVLYGDLLVLVRDGCDQQYVTALDKRTGETVWKTDRPPIEADRGALKKAFSTPLVIDVGGRRQMVIPGAHWVVSYEPETGNPIWRVRHGKGFSNVPRPVFGHGMVYITTGFAVPQLWAIRVDGQGDVTDTHVVWRAKRQIPRRSSPVLVGDELYIVSDTGVLTCFDARSGDVHWQDRIAGDYSASPVYADGQIYFFSHEGTTTVFRPGKEPVRLAESQLDGQQMASPAVVGGAFFLRTDTHLYRIEKR